MAHAALKEETGDRDAENSDKLRNLIGRMTPCGTEERRRDRRLMPRQYRHLSRPVGRALRPGDKITEGGVTAAKLGDGDVRYSVNVKGGHWRGQPLSQEMDDVLVRERDVALDRDGWAFPSPQSRSGHIFSMKMAFRCRVVRAGLDPERATLLGRRARRR
jgi:hypothetical protein